MLHGLKIGMSYDEAKDMFRSAIQENESAGGMEWFKAAIDKKMFGMYPIIQVASKNNKVVEIFAVINWDMYHEKANGDTAMGIWIECLKQAESAYGSPSRIKNYKMIWELEDGIEIKIKYDRDAGFEISILIG